MRVKVKKHYRHDKQGKLYTVKRYARRNRKLGKKVRFKEIGKFQVAHDELGNFRGSKIVLFKKGKSSMKPLKIKVPKPRPRKIIKSRRPAKRSRPLSYNLNDLDTDYYIGRISYQQWMEARQNLR